MAVHDNQTAGGERESFDEFDEFNRIDADDPAAIQYIMASNSRLPRFREGSKPLTERQTKHFRSSRYGDGRTSWPVRSRYDANIRSRMCTTLCMISLIDKWFLCTKRTYGLNEQPARLGGVTQSD